MYIIDKIKKKSKINSAKISISNIEKVNIKLYQKPNENSNLEDDIMLFI